VTDEILARIRKNGDVAQAPALSF